MKLDALTHKTSLAYMQRWFIGKHHLAKLCAIDEQLLDTLIEAGCAPGIIYSYHDTHGWWSALAAARGNMEKSPPPGGQDWYTPGAKWWLRRAILAMNNGADATQAAQISKDYFLTQFKEKIRTIPYAHHLFEGNIQDIRALSTETVNHTAKAKWQSWIDGAFGVCLIHFSAQTCIRKSALGKWIKTILHDRTANTASITNLQIFNHVEELAPLMTPFTPWERPVGTPGLAIDSALEKLGLGAEFPHELG